MFARVPASSANLGPGFDTLGLALARYLEVTVEDAAEFSISSSGFGAGQFDHADHLAAEVIRRVRGSRNFRVHVHSEIPLSRGLGSSAALVVAAAAAAGADDETILALATEYDGHAENAAASLYGGLVVASVTEQDGIIWRRLALDEAWRFVVVVPEQELATAAARRVLPDSVPFSDAVHNVTAVSLLLAGLARQEDFVSSAMDDYLHQPYRMALVDFAAPLLATLRAAGASGACWSGAGSTMLALCREDAVTTVASAASALLAERGVAGQVWEIEADRVGLVRR